MSKLISADLPRVFKSKITYVVLLLTAFMSVASVYTAFIETDDKSLVFHAASNSLIMMMSMIMPVFSGGLSIILIAAEFSGGIIRNKFIMGHKRTDILFSWGIIYTLFTVLTYILYIGIFFIALTVAGVDLSGVDFRNVFINLFIVLMFTVKFQMFSFLLVCIYPDAKSAVIAYILNNTTIAPLMLLSMSNNTHQLIKFLSRILIFGYTDGKFTLMTEPDKPWLTVLLITVISVVYMVLAVIYFNRKDLK